jgi:glycine cleavage system H protein
VYNTIFYADYLKSQIFLRSKKMQNPESLKYTKSDEWVKVDGNVATVGVTDYAQSQLSDIVYLEFLVEADDEISQGDSIVTLESVKAAADVNTPVSGKVVALNEDLTEGFESVNTDAFGKAWMIKLNLSDPSELESLMTADEYTKYCNTREH